MNPAGPALALLSAAAWGAGDFFGGVASRSGGVLVALLLSQGFGTILTLVLLWLVGEAPPPPMALGWAAAAGAAGLMGVGCLYLALSRGTMALVAPMTALIGATVPAIVGLARGEPMEPLLAIGMLVALLAVVMISVPDRSADGGAGQGIGPGVAWSHGRLGGEWLLILGAGLGFAGFYLGVDAAREAGGGTFFTLLSVRVTSTTIVIASTLVLLTTGRIPRVRVPRAAAILGLLAALGDTGGNLFYILANAVGSLSVTVVLASLYPVSTVILARLILHERLSVGRLAGVGLALLGVVLISAGALRPQPQG